MTELIDTSVLVDFINERDASIEKLIAERRLLIHPFVVGEIALGDLPDRTLLQYLDDLPQPEIADTVEVRYAIEKYALAGSGIGFVDTHLLVSTLLTPGSRLLTRDKRLAAVAERLDIAA